VERGERMIERRERVLERDVEERGETGGVEDGMEEEIKRAFFFFFFFFFLGLRKCGREERSKR
jgi:hypothetical protein